MKKGLLILLCLPMIGFGQLTYVPDDNFEQALINMGYDNMLDDYVQTSNINTLTYLSVTGQSISDLTGIEDFTALTSLWCNDNQLTSLDVTSNDTLVYLHCNNNQLATLNLNGANALTTLYGSFNPLTSLDVSQNTALSLLYCDNNQLTSIDVSNNASLEHLNCYNNQITSLDITQNTFLETLSCDSNQLTSLDLTQNTALRSLSCNSTQITSLDVSQNTFLEMLHYCNNQLTSLDVTQNTFLEVLDVRGNQLTSLDLTQHTFLEALGCSDNQLAFLDLRNGNNISLEFLWCNGNPNLSCINVDDSVWSNTNWISSLYYTFDPQQYFSNNCSGTGIEEHTINKHLLKVTDLLGRETKQTNQPLFYIYDDGTVEKRIIIE